MDTNFFDTHTKSTEFSGFVYSFTTIALGCFFPRSVESFKLKVQRSKQSLTVCPCLPPQTKILDLNFFSVHS